MGMESLLTIGLQAGGLAMQMAGANASNKAARQESMANFQLGLDELKTNYELTRIQDEQLIGESKLIDASAGQAVAARLDQATRQKVRNAAFVTASGTSYNASEEVAARETDKNARRDITSIKFNAASQKGRIADQITVNRMGLDTAAKRVSVGAWNGLNKAEGIRQQGMYSTMGSLIKYVAADVEKMGDSIGKAFGMGS